MVGLFGVTDTVGNGLTVMLMQAILFAQQTVGGTVTQYVPAAMTVII